MHMVQPSDGLNPKQQWFGNLVLGGMAASTAYRAAGYKATTNAAAEANGSRLIKTNRVAAYLTAKRAAAAERSELSLASVLKDVVRLANDERVERSSRVAAFKLLLEHVARSTPPASRPLPVPEAADEDDLDRRGLAIVDAMLAGQITPAQANEMAQVVTLGVNIAHGATLGADLCRYDAPPAVPLASDRPPTMPKWLKRDLPVHVAR